MKISPYFNLLSLSLLMCASNSKSASANIKAPDAAANAHWELIWSDEFSGSAVDNSKWTFSKNCFGGGNNELQCYTDRSKNTLVDNGQLHIIARKELVQGSAKEDSQAGYDAKDTSVSRDYSSARLHSQRKGDWKYGRMEISAKMPQGQGIWPAIWMLPSEWKYGVWPRSGEIDILEAINSNTGTFGNSIHGTLHYGNAWPKNSLSGTEYVPASNIWDSFHRYAVEWEEGEIRWYIDDVHYATQTKKAWFTQYLHKGKLIKSNNAAPFDQPFYLILNLAVGGEWPKSPTEATQFPQQMDVDYVRVYRCTAGLVTGKGCATPSNPNVIANTPTTTLSN